MDEFIRMVLNNAARRTFMPEDRRKALLEIILAFLEKNPPKRRLQ